MPSGSGVGVSNILAHTIQHKRTNIQQNFCFSMYMRAEQEFRETKTRTSNQGRVRENTYVTGGESFLHSEKTRLL